MYILYRSHSLLLGTKEKHTFSIIFHHFPFQTESPLSLSCVLRDRHCFWWSLSQRTCWMSACDSGPTRGVASSSGSKDARNAKAEDKDAERRAFSSLAVCTWSSICFTHSRKGSSCSSAACLSSVSCLPSFSAAAKASRSSSASFEGWFQFFWSYTTRAKWPKQGILDWKGTRKEPTIIEKIIENCSQSHAKSQTNSKLIHLKKNTNHHITSHQSFLFLLPWSPT